VVAVDHRVIVLVSVGNLGAVGKVSSLFSDWVSNILLLAMAIYMVYKTQKKISFAVFDWILDTLRVKALFYK